MNSQNPFPSGDSCCGTNYDMTVDQLLGTQLDAVLAKFTDLAETSDELALRQAEMKVTQGEQEASITELATVTDGLAKQSSSMSVRIGDNEAGLRQEIEARVTADEAMTVRIDQAESKVGENTARIAAEEQTRASEDAALAQRITRMEAGQVDGFDTGRAWNFDASLEGWRAYGSGAQVSWVNETPMFMRLGHNPSGATVQRADTGVIPSDSRSDVQLYSFLRARVRVAAGYTVDYIPVFVSFDASTAPGTEYRMPIDKTVTGWQTAELDLTTHSLFPGAQSVSRIVIGRSSYGVTDFDYIALGRIGAPLSHALLQEEARARADADGALAQAVDTLRTTTETEDARLDAAIKTEAQARTTAVDAQAQRITQLKAEYNVQANGENLIRDPYWDAPQIHWSGSLLNRFSKRTLPLNNQNDGNGYPFVASMTGTGGAANAFFGDLITRRDATDGSGDLRQPIEGGKTYTFSGKIALNNNDSVGVVQVRCAFHDANGNQVSDPILATADLSAQGVWPWSATFTAPGSAASFRFRYRFIYGPQGGDFRVTNMGLFATRMQLQSVSEASNAADIRTEQTTRADADTALGQRIDTVTSRVGTVETSVATQANTLATLDGRISSNWTVRVQANNAGRKYLAGIGVGIQSDGNGGTVDSYITMIADRLVLLTSVNGTLSSPFSVVNGQTFINDAFIRNASITTAKIADANITGAKIGAAQIQNVHIADANITAAKIADANITTAKIGVAQIDTLRIANGAVVGGTAGSWATEFGSSGNRRVPIGNISLYLPYGGTLLAFIQAYVDGGTWSPSVGGVEPRIIASINGNPIILNKGPMTTPGHSNVELISGYSYVYGPVGPGTYTLFMDVYRPIDGRAVYRVSAALLGFQR